MSYRRLTALFFIGDTLTREATLRATAYADAVIDGEARVSPTTRR